MAPPSLLRRLDSGRVLLHLKGRAGLREPSFYLAEFRTSIDIFRVGGEWVKPFSGWLSLLPLVLGKSSVPFGLHREIWLTEVTASLQPGISCWFLNE